MHLRHNVFFEGVVAFDYLGGMVKKHEEKTPGIMGPTGAKGKVSFPLPYTIVKKLKLKLHGLKTIQQAALIQYRMLLLKEVIRAAIMAGKNEATIIYDPKASNAQEVARKLEEAAKVYSITAEVIGEEDLDYKELVEQSFNLPPDYKPPEQNPAKN